MKVKPLLITNNNKSYEYSKEKMEVIFIEEGTYMDVLLKVRDYIHRGHKLISHPMAGSVKPNQTPYRSVIIEADKSNQKEVLDSLTIIENSIASAEKFLSAKSIPDWNNKTKEDFKTVDLSFISYFVDGINKQ